MLNILRRLFPYRSAKHLENDICFFTWCTKRNNQFSLLHYFWSLTEPSVQGYGDKQIWPLHFKKLTV